MTIEAEYQLGELVYLKSDEKQLVRIVIALYVTDAGIKYQLASGTNTDYHYAIEISRDKANFSNDKIGFGR